MTDIAVSKLKFGQDYPPGCINIRSVDRDADLPELTASIKAEGLLQPLVGVEHNGDFYIADGNRRLAALKKLKLETIHESNLWLIDGTSVEDIKTKALAANIQRVPMHEVDRYEAFAALNLPPEKIAERFGVDIKVVKRALALGNLCDVIRKDWKAGKLRSDVARAFTLQPDLKLQEQVYNRLKKSHQIHSDWVVRREITGNVDAERVADLLAYVGEPEYLAAGGVIVHDLFFVENETRSVVGNYELLVKCAKDKAEAFIAKLKEEGWSWVAFDFELPMYWHHDMQIIGKKADKAKTGCVVAIKNGKLDITVGVSKTKAKVAGEKRTEAKRANPNKISNALMRRIDRWNAVATKKALTMIATHNATNNPLMAVLAETVARIIFPDRAGFTPDPVTKALPDIRNATLEITIASELVKAFDRKDYFSNAPKLVVLKAVEECFGKETVTKLAAKSKPDIWKFALANLPSTYLPPAMRTKRYTVAKAKDGTRLAAEGTLEKAKGKKGPAKKKAPARRKAA